MVRETRYLLVRNLPEKSTEEVIINHFERYGKIQSVKLHQSKENDGTATATVAFMDIKSASKANNAENSLENCLLRTEYCEGSATGSAITRTHEPTFHHPPAARGSGSFPWTKGEDESTRHEHNSPDVGNYEKHQASYGNDQQYRGRSTQRIFGAGKFGHGKPFERSGNFQRPNLSRHTEGQRQTVENYGTEKDSFDRPRAPPSPPHSHTSSRHSSIARKKSVSISRSPSRSRSRSPRSRSRSSSSGSWSSHSSASRSRSRSRASSHGSRPQGSLAAQKVPASEGKDPKLDKQKSEDQSSTQERRPLGINVTGLPLRSSDTSLRDGLFHEYKKHGKVTSVQVFGESGERYAIVSFRRPEDAAKALEASQEKMFFGTKIKVESHEGVVTEVEDSEFRPSETELDEYHPKATRTLFVGNLEKDTSIQDLIENFKAFGEIIDVDIKRQGAASAYAFVQYADIVSVVKSLRQMEGEHIGANKIKLGFGKSMPTNCVWLDNVGDNVGDKFLCRVFSRYGEVSHGVIDRIKGRALIYFSNLDDAQYAANEMRNRNLGGKKIHIDFASRECQNKFFDKMEKTGQLRPGEWPDERGGTRVRRGFEFTENFQEDSAQGRGAFTQFSRKQGTFFRGSRNNRTGTFRGRGRTGFTESFQEEFGTRRQRSTEGFTQSNSDYYKSTDDSYEQELREYAREKGERERRERGHTSPRRQDDRSYDDRPRRLSIDGYDDRSKDRQLEMYRSESPGSDRNSYRSESRFRTRSEDKSYRERYSEQDKHRGDRDFDMPSDLSRSQSPVSFQSPNRSPSRRKDDPELSARSYTPPTPTEEEPPMYRAQYYSGSCETEFPRKIRPEKIDSLHRHHSAEDSMKSQPWSVVSVAPGTGKPQSEIVKVPEKLSSRKRSYDEAMMAKETAKLEHKISKKMDRLESAVGLSVKSSITLDKGKLMSSKAFLTDKLRLDRSDKEMLMRHRYDKLMTSSPGSSNSHPESENGSLGESDLLELHGKKALLLQKLQQLDDTGSTSDNESNQNEDVRNVVAKRLENTKGLKVDSRLLKSIKCVKISEKKLKPEEMIDSTKSYRKQMEKLRFLEVKPVKEGTDKRRKKSLPSAIVPIIVTKADESEGEEIVLSADSPKEISADFRQIKRRKYDNKEGENLKVRSYRRKDKTFISDDESEVKSLKKRDSFEIMSKSAKHQEEVGSYSALLSSSKSPRHDLHTPIEPNELVEKKSLPIIIKDEPDTHLEDPRKKRFYVYDERTISSSVAGKDVSPHIVPADSSTNSPKEDSLTIVIHNSPEYLLSPQDSDDHTILQSEKVTEMSPKDVNLTTDKWIRPSPYDTLETSAKQDTREKERCVENVESVVDSTSVSNMLKAEMSPVSAGVVEDCFSDSSEEMKTPGELTLEERIRRIDEQMSILVPVLPKPADPKFKVTGKLPEASPIASTPGVMSTISEKKTELSDFAKQFLVRSSILDQDSKRLENIREKYEPKEVTVNLAISPPKTFTQFRTKAAVKQMSRFGDLQSQMVSFGLGCQSAGGQLSPAVPPVGVAVRPCHPTALSFRHPMSASNVNQPSSTIGANLQPASTSHVHLQQQQQEEQSSVAVADQPIVQPSGFVSPRHQGEPTSNLHSLQQPASTTVMHAPSPPVCRPLHPISTAVTTSVVHEPVSSSTGTVPVAPPVSLPVSVATESPKLGQISSKKPIEPTSVISSHHRESHTDMSSSLAPNPVNVSRLDSSSSCSSNLSLSPVAPPVSQPELKKEQPSELGCVKASPDKDTSPNLKKQASGNEKETESVTKQNLPPVLFRSKSSEEKVARANSKLTIQSKSFDLFEKKIEISSDKKKDTFHKSHEPHRQQSSHKEKEKVDSSTAKKDSEIHEKSHKQSSSPEKRLPKSHCLEKEHAKEERKNDHIAPKTSDKLRHDSGAKDKGGHKETDKEKVKIKTKHKESETRKEKHKESETSVADKPKVKDKSHEDRKKEKKVDDKKDDKKVEEKKEKKVEKKEKSDEKKEEKKEKIKLKDTKQEKIKQLTTVSSDTKIEKVDRVSATKSSHDKSSKEHKEHKKHSAPVLKEKDKYQKKKKPKENEESEKAGKVSGSGSKEKPETNSSKDKNNGKSSKAKSDKNEKKKKSQCPDQKLLQELASLGSFEPYVSMYDKVKRRSIEKDKEKDLEDVRKQFDKLQKTRKKGKASLSEETDSSFINSDEESAMSGTASSGHEDDDIVTDKMRKKKLHVIESSSSDELEKIVKEKRKKKPRGSTLKKARQILGTSSDSEEEMEIQTDGSDEGVALKDVKKRGTKKRKSRDYRSEPDLNDSFEEIKNESKTPVNLLTMSEVNVTDPETMDEGDKKVPETEKKEKQKKVKKKPKDKEDNDGEPALKSKKKETEKHEKLEDRADKSKHEDLPKTEDLEAKKEHTSEHKKEKKIASEHKDTKKAEEWREGKKSDSKKAKYLKEHKISLKQEEKPDGSDIHKDEGKVKGKKMDTKEEIKTKVAKQEEGKAKTVKSESKVLETKSACKSSKLTIKEEDKIKTTKNEPKNDDKTGKSDTKEDDNTRASKSEAKEEPKCKSEKMDAKEGAKSKTVKTESKEKKSKSKLKRPSKDSEKVPEEEPVKPPAVVFSPVPEKNIFAEMEAYSKLPDFGSKQFEPPHIEKLSSREEESEKECSLSPVKTKKTKKKKRKKDSKSKEFVADEGEHQHQVDEKLSSVGSVTEHELQNVQKHFNLDMEFEDISQDPVVEEKSEIAAQDKPSNREHKNKDSSISSKSKRAKGHSKAKIQAVDSFDKDLDIMESKNRHSSGDSKDAFSKDVESKDGDFKDIQSKDGDSKDVHNKDIVESKDRHLSDDSKDVCSRDIMELKIKDSGGDSKDLQSKNIFEYEYVHTYGDSKDTQNRDALDSKDRHSSGDSKNSQSRHIGDSKDRHSSGDSKNSQSGHIGDSKDQHSSGDSKNSQSRHIGDSKDQHSSGDSEDPLNQDKMEFSDEHSGGEYKGKEMDLKEKESSCGLLNKDLDILADIPESLIVDRVDHHSVGDAKGKECADAFNDVKYGSNSSKDKGSSSDAGEKDLCVETKQKDTRVESKEKDLIFDFMHQEAVVEANSEFSANFRSKELFSFKGDSKRSKKTMLDKERISHKKERPKKSRKKDKELLVGPLAGSAGGMHTNDGFLTKKQMETADSIYEFDDNSSGGDIPLLGFQMRETTDSVKERMVNFEHVTKKEQGETGKSSFETAKELQKSTEIVADKNENTTSKPEKRTEIDWSSLFQSSFQETKPLAAGDSPCSLEDMDPNNLVIHFPEEHDDEESVDLTAHLGVPDPSSLPRIPSAEASVPVSSSQSLSSVNSSQSVTALGMQPTDEIEAEEYDPRLTCSIDNDEKAVQEASDEAARAVESILFDDIPSFKDDIPDVPISDSQPVMSFDVPLPVEKEPVSSEKEPMPQTEEKPVPTVYEEENKVEKPEPKSEELDIKQTPVKRPRRRGRSKGSRGHKDEPETLPEVPNIEARPEPQPEAQQEIQPEPEKTVIPGSAQDKWVFDRSENEEPALNIPSITQDEPRVLRSPRAERSRGRGQRKRGRKPRACTAANRDGSEYQAEIESGDRMRRSSNSEETCPPRPDQSASKFDVSDSSGLKSDELDSTLEEEVDQDVKSDSDAREGQLIIASDSEDKLSTQENVSPYKSQRSTRKRKPTNYKMMDAGIVPTATSPRITRAASSPRAQRGAQSPKNVTSPRGRGSPKASEIGSPVVKLEKLEIGRGRRKEETPKKLGFMKDEPYEDHVPSTFEDWRLSNKLTFTDVKSTTSKENVYEFEASEQEPKPELCLRLRSRKPKTVEPYEPFKPVKETTSVVTQVAPPAPTPPQPVASTVEPTAVEQLAHLTSQSNPAFLSSSTEESSWHISNVDKIIDAVAKGMFGVPEALTEITEESKSERPIVPVSILLSNTEGILEETGHVKNQDVPVPTSLAVDALKKEPAIKEEMSVKSEPLISGASSHETHFANKTDIGTLTQTSTVFSRPETQVPPAMQSRHDVITGTPQAQTSAASLLQNSVQPQIGPVSKSLDNILTKILSPGQVHSEVRPQLNQPAAVPRSIPCTYVPTSVVTQNPNPVSKPSPAPVSVPSQHKPRNIPQPIMTPPPPKLSPTGGIQPQRPQSVQLPLTRMQVSSPDVTSMHRPPSAHSYPHMQQPVPGWDQHSRSVQQPVDANASKPIDAPTVERGKLSHEQQHPFLSSQGQQQYMRSQIPPAHMGQRLPVPQGLNFLHGAPEGTRPNVPREQQQHGRAEEGSRHPGPELARLREGQRQTGARSLPPHLCMVERMPHPSPHEIVRHPVPGEMQHPEQGRHQGQGEQMHHQGQGQIMHRQTLGDQVRHPAPDRHSGETIHHPGTEQMRRLQEMHHHGEMRHSVPQELMHRLRMGQIIESQVHGRSGEQMRHLREEQARHGGQGDQMRHVRPGEARQHEEPQHGGTDLIRYGLPGEHMLQDSQRCGFGEQRHAVDAREELQKLAHNQHVGAVQQRDVPGTQQGGMQHPRRHGQSPDQAVCVKTPPATSAANTLYAGVVVGHPRSLSPKTASPVGQVIERLPNPMRQAEHISGSPANRMTLQEAQMQMRQPKGTESPRNAPTPSSQAEVRPPSRDQMLYASYMQHRQMLLHQQAAAAAVAQEAARKNQRLTEHPHPVPVSTPPGHPGISRESAVAHQQPVSLTLSDCESRTIQEHGGRVVKGSQAYAIPVYDRKPFVSQAEGRIPCSSASAFVPPGGGAHRGEIPQGVPPHLYGHGEIPVAAFGQGPIRFPGLPVDPRNIYQSTTRQQPQFLAGPEIPMSALHQSHYPQQILGPHNFQLDQHAAEAHTAAARQEQDQRGLVPSTPLSSSQTQAACLPGPVAAEISTSSLQQQMIAVRMAAEAASPAENVVTILQRYPVVWQGAVALKNDNSFVQMHYIAGNRTLPKSTLPQTLPSGVLQPLRIAQRMRLEPSQLDGVSKRMQLEEDFCILLAMPCGRDHNDISEQTKALSEGVIHYLLQKQAAGIVNIPMPGSSQPAYVVHIFPPCEFSHEAVARHSQGLACQIRDLAHVVIIIATV